MLLYFKEKRDEICTTSFKIRAIIPTCVLKNKTSYTNTMIYFFLFQIDRQLSAYMRRVEDVLGKGWENHVEGQRLKADGDSFRQKLNTQELFDDWSRKVGNSPVITLEPLKKMTV